MLDRRDAQRQELGADLIKDAGGRADVRAPLEDVVRPELGERLRDEADLVVAVARDADLPHAFKSAVYHPSTEKSSS